MDSDFEEESDTYVYGPPKDKEANQSPMPIWPIIGIVVLIALVWIFFGS